MTVRPIFLLSLPRAGSTLTQRVIGAHAEVSTTSEPWVLSPLLYGVREEGARAEYWHKAAAQAIGDFCGHLDGGVEGYRREAKAMALRLYSSASEPGTSFFLDKTPHYHWIAEELIDLFDEAKFVFLWRNPLAVIASLMETFRGGRWEPYLLRTDLFDGVSNLTSALHRAGPRAIGVRYEDLVSGDETWRRLFDYLELEFEPAILENFQNVELGGRFGDPGSREYTAISSGSLDSWQRVIANPLRRRWCRRYLDWIGEESLAVMGYDLGELRLELAGLGNERAVQVPIDAFRLASSWQRSRLWARRLEKLDSPLPIWAESRHRTIRRTLSGIRTKGER